MLEYFIHWTGDVAIKFRTLNWFKLANFFVISSTLKKEKFHIFIWLNRGTSWNTIFFTKKINRDTSTTFSIIHNPICIRRLQMYGLDKRKEHMAKYAYKCKIALSYIRNIRNIWNIKKTLYVFLQRSIHCLALRNLKCDRLLLLVNFA